VEHRILIVDDNEVNVEILQQLLCDKYELDVARSGEECLEKLRSFNPDLVLLDVMMPGIDGYETCRQIKQSPYGSFTQVIMVSGRGTSQERLRGYDNGADDYLVKPFDHDELLAKIHVQFRMREVLAQLWRANAQIQAFNAELDRLVKLRTREVIATRDIAVFALAKLAESRDSETGEHLERMCEYCKILAEQLSLEGPYTDVVDKAFIDDLYRSSPLHDIGKVGIPDGVLLKPGRLTEEEFEIMKQHAEIGAAALEQAASKSESGGFLRMAIDICRHHHERFDGKGYPCGLAGQQIPLSARIVTVADVFDALTSHRVYKRAIEPPIALKMMEEQAGQQFDPAIVAAMQVRFDDFLKVVKEKGRPPWEPTADLALAADTARR